ncbi:MAG TPA: bifunctional diaminohydroxyphosphoribosylaminopyrimidine deaminase/5-amino-6-(5-phosphoribosylamino)uracil reductase RibD, partial [Candidatus Binataceae bacterium]|nr:bifunctional diaminohydroxyphosphoribosylaminopyrimidine deaminase/5-amino-6-(5-phosphoribosylamino)uracil reductase RibD [Candidatus Binataceae bacterium]
QRKEAPRHFDIATLAIAEATSTSNSQDERLMHECLALAEERLGLTSPNPAVGCVIVRGNRIVGRGATAIGGRPHAETQALSEAEGLARGATAYVSFEPCAHQGQTPPCARALVEAGVARVVVGCLDPYPPVRGRGVSILKAAGIATVVGVLEQECRRLNEGFISRVTRGRPFVTLKLAMSLDGRIAAADGDSRWISSESSRRLVHRWRREADVVMVGAGTVIADNPRLTCRIEGGRDPIRVVVDQRLRSPVGARIFHQKSRAPTIIATAEAKAALVKRRYGKRVEAIAVPATGDEIALGEVMRELGRRGYGKVLVEGGAHLAGSALRARVVDRVAFFIAPRIIGCGLPSVEGILARTVRAAIRLENLNARLVGDDWLLEADVTRKNTLKRGAHAKLSPSAMR